MALRPASDRWHNWADRAPGLLTLIVPLASFLAVHLLLRLQLSSSLHGDGADIIFFNQSLALGYSEQPPLFSWLFWLWSRLFGATVFSLGLFRAMLLGGTVYLLYLSARRITGRHALAVMAAFSVLLLPSFVWKASYVTHSLLLGLCCAATSYALLGVIERARRRDYLLLGMCVALGLLSKYTYILFLAALLSAGMSVRPVRQRLLDRRMGLSFAIVVLLALPHGLWLFRHWPLLADIFQERVTRRDGSPLAGVLPHGVVPLLLGFAAVAALPITAFGWVFRRELRATPDEADRTAAYRRLFGTFFVFLVVISLACVLLAQVKDFPARWLEPFFLLMPLYLFSLLAARPVGRHRMARYAALLVVLAVGLTTARCGHIWLGRYVRQPNVFDYSFAEAARHLGAECAAGDVLVTPDSGIAGNLRHHLPHLPCVSTRHPAFCPRHARRARRYVLVWEVPTADAAECAWPRKVDTLLGHGAAADGKTYFLRADPLLPGRRPLHLAYTVATQGEPFARVASPRSLIKRP